MRFDIITIFPKIFDSYFGESILGRARKNGLIEINARDLRQWTDDKHKTVDDSPYGGGAGMIFKVEPIYKAVEELKKVKSKNEKGKNKRRVILFSAKGKQFTQADARRLAKYDQLILICGRYEGVDERVAEHIADEEVSVGNFVLTGGEIPAMIMVDAVARLLPGVLGKKESLKEESFSKRLRTADYGLRPKNNKLSTDHSLRSTARALAVDSRQSTVDNYLEYPQYTRPENFRGWKAPKVLLSGDHGKIREWRNKKAGISQ